MHYYHILPADPSYHKNEPLTYSASEPLPQFSVVEIPIKNKYVPGLVLQQTSKPKKFTVKSISKAPALQLTEKHYTLLRWLQSYYPSGMGKALSLFLPSYSLFPLKKPPAVQNTAANKKLALPPLTAAQADAYSAINKSSDNLFLLHGDTGSGKTRLYIELITEQIKQGKCCLVLVPEIGLSPQLYNELTKYIAAPIVVLHSKMTPKQKSSAFNVINQSAPTVTVGPRSAIFSPFTSLGVIIMDESHDQSYKQEQAPYYVTSRVVAKMAAIWDCKAVLGSATPDVADYFVFEQKKLPILRIAGLAKKHNYTSDTTIIDIKNKSNFTKSRLLSNQAVASIDQNISTKVQSLIFHNRRGSARIIICQTCTWQALCPHCDINLTYHADTHQLLCHSCGHTARSITSCPDCKGKDIIYTAAGTKALEQELKSLFPTAKIIRFDADNKKSDSLAAQYNSIAKGEYDIIIGTQVITKGLDLPLLKTVVVSSAESEMNFPDFNARQSSYQQLTQIIGRANRGHQQSEVFIQTLEPKNKLLNFVINSDYTSFYNNEISERKLYNFPPFTYQLVIKISRKTQAGVSKAAKQLHSAIESKDSDYSLTLPYPAFKEKIAGNYRWQIIARSSNRSSLVKLIKTLPTNNITYDIDPISLL